MESGEFLIDDGLLMGYAGQSTGTVTVPDGVTAIGSHAFAGCSATGIILPETLRYIDEYAFIECGCLQSIHLPDSVTHIGMGAFRRCDSLSRVRLPKGLIELPDACFYVCLSLKELTLPHSVRRVGVRALADCSGLLSITLPDSLEEIDEFAFEYCTRLESIRLPEGLRSIARHAFYCCHQLRDIRIPESVTHIGRSAFYQTAYVESAEGLLISDSGILIHCADKSETVTVPDGVKAVGEMAFAYNKTVQRVIIPEGVTEICANAFERCTALKSISLPESLRTIGETAFRDCPSLTDITLPKGLTHIGENIFEPRYLAPAGMRVMSGKYLISSRQCGESPKIPYGVELIAGGAFSENDDLKSIDLPDCVRTVDVRAFCWCRELERAHIPASVTYIGEEAFAYCGGLHVTLDRARRMIGSRCFVEGQHITFEDGERSFTVQLLNDLTPGSPEHALMGFAAEPSQSRFAGLYYPEYLIPAAVCYAAEGREYTNYLRENILPALRYAVDLRDSELTRRILELGLLSERQAAEAAAYAIEQKAFEQQILIMRHKQDSFGSVAEAAIDDRFDW